jgi:hypothetical protein
LYQLEKEVGAQHGIKSWWRSRIKLVKKEAEKYQYPPKMKVAFPDHEV